MSIITIRIEVPDGTTVSVDAGGPPIIAPRIVAPGEPPYPDFDNEPLPNPPGEVVAFRGSAQATYTQPAKSEVCPLHNVPWKTVPAGVSKKTGKAYEEFRACPTAGCNERPR